MSGKGWEIIESFGLLPSTVQCVECPEAPDRRLLICAAVLGNARHQFYCVVRFMLMPATILVIFVEVYVDDKGAGARDVTPVEARWRHPRAVHECHSMCRGAPLWIRAV